MKENPNFLNNLINYELDKKHKGKTNGRKNYFWEEIFCIKFQRGEMFSNDDCEDNDEE